MLRVDFKKRMGEFVLEVNLQIAPGFTALFGPSGAGKTTTLNLLTGLVHPDEGVIELNGRILYSRQRRIHLPPQERNIGYIFQESRLFPHLTVKKNLQFGLRKLPHAKRKFTVDEIVGLTGVASLLERMPANLSGGEKQRVALARALLASPDFLLMDEPLAALDLTTRLAFLTFLKKIHRKLNLPILYVSHDLANVLNFADEVILLEDGKNIGYGPPYSLLDKMSAPPLASHEDIPNIFDVEVLTEASTIEKTIAKAETLKFILPRLHCAARTKLQLNIPASEIILATAEPKNLSASNIFPGTILEIYHLQERVLVEVDAEEKFTVEIVPATIHRLGLEKGKRVYLIIKASSFRRLG